jgi:hypothetical protein
MARLQSNTTIYGTANVQGTLFVGSVTPSTSNSNTTGSLVVTGGIGLTGPIYSTGGSITINNGIVGAGNTGTIYLGDGSFSKTFGSGWTFGGGMSITGALSLTGGYLDLISGSNTQPIVKNQNTNNGMYFPAGQGAIAFSANQANSLFITAPTGGVNYLQVSGALVNTSPILSSQGTDANVSISLVPKGNAAVMITGNTVGYIPASNSIYVGNRVGFANSNNISISYQVYNPATLSIDTYFG